MTDSTSGSASETVAISTEYIQLDQLLKHSDCVGTGGEAKLVIQDGIVTVNGEPETRRGRKIRPGDVIGFYERVFEVVAEDG